jgi:hypothetical protein
MSETDVAVARIDIDGFIVWKIFILQGTEKRESREGFIVQNCYLEKRKRITFLSKHFQIMTYRKRHCIPSL